jgi:hypothetical protein
MFKDGGLDRLLARGRDHIAESLILAGLASIANRTSAPDHVSAQSALRMADSGSTAGRTGDGSRPRGTRLGDDGGAQKFDSLEDARLEALTSLRELAAEAIRVGRPFEYSSIEITDEQGAKLAAVLASEACPQLR